MRKSSLVLATLLLILTLAGCTVPLIDQTGRSSAESGRSTKGSREQTESSSHTTIETEYDRAMELFNNGEYEAAKAIFDSLHNYKDSPDMAAACADKLSALATANIKQLLLSADIGSYVSFGSYEQDGDTADGSEEIEWLILNRTDKSVLLISKLALFVPDWETFWAETDNIVEQYSFKEDKDDDWWYWNDETARKEGTRKCVEYLYDWLNEYNYDFYMNAFSATEKELLVPDSSQITVMTADETSLFRDESQKRVPATNYAILNGAYYDKRNGNTNWLVLAESDLDIATATVYDANEYEGFDLGLLFKIICSVDPKSNTIEDISWEQICLRPVIRMELGTEQTLPEPTKPEETSVPATEPVISPPAFTVENITPYTRMVTDLAYAVLQRGTLQSLTGSLEMSRSKAAARFKLDELHAMFEYCYRNEDLLLDPVFGGTYDAANSVRYCQADQDKIILTLKALLNLEVGREGYPAAYDSSWSPLCIWNQSGLFLCLPMMGEAPGAVFKDLVLSEGKVLLYADVLEPFNNVPTDRLVVTLIPAENELGFTVESISLNPNAAADPTELHALEDGTYDLWYNFTDLSSPYGRDYDVLAVNYTEGVEMTVTLKSTGQYIKLTKDYLETTFLLHGIDKYNKDTYTQEGELIRVPVSPAIQNDIVSWLDFMKWIFTEGAFELFCFEMQDGMMISFNTVS